MANVTFAAMFFLATSTFSPCGDQIADRDQNDNIRFAGGFGFHCVVPNGPVCPIPPAPLGMQCVCFNMLGYVAP